MSVAKCKTTRTHSVYGMHAAQCADGEIRSSEFGEMRLATGHRVLLMAEWRCALQSHLEGNV